MARRRTVAAAALVGVVLLVLIVLEFGLWLALIDPGEYERGQVTIEDDAGERLGTVDVRIADTADKHTIGLSRTDELGPDEGMLFVHEENDRHRYVMRDMAFPLDVVFVDANGTVTEIRHADPAGGLTPESLLQRYSGEGTYVLEVARGWTNASGVAVGDRVVLPDGVGTDELQEPTPTATPTDTPTPSETATATATPTPTQSLPTVDAADANGTELGTVGVGIADNQSERYTGLSETASMPSDEGMLFVYGSEGSRAFVMRNMSFDLDMIFVAGNGTITEIHHASVPPEGTEESELQLYRGEAQYVLEVNRGWTNETGLDEGDTVRVPETHRTPTG